MSERLHWQINFKFVWIDSNVCEICNIELREDSLVTNSDMILEGEDIYWLVSHPWAIRILYFEPF